MLHHDHAHHHSQSREMKPEADGSLRRAFKLGIWLNIIYVAFEAVFGFINDSMGLLSDAGHNLSDVASLVIALIAFKAAGLGANSRFTYGYRKATVEASALNAMILYAAVAFILVESIEKLINPTDVDGDTVAWVAGIGVIVNGFTAWLFMKDSKIDLNVKGAYLHMAADTLVSVGVVVSGIVISLTGWYLIDPIIGILIAALIAISSFSMLKESLRLALDGVPPNIDIEKVHDSLATIAGVVGVHHLHIWPISTTETAMTVHVVVDNPLKLDKVIAAVKDKARLLGIEHSTVEAETSKTECSCVGGQNNQCL